MKEKKDLVMAILATFCLTATLFMILPIKSNPGDYNPWMDSNEDGMIDIYDAISMANVFGTSGDPTKNVNIVEIHNETWAPYWKVIHVAENRAILLAPTTDGYSTLDLGIVTVEGYSRMRIYAIILDEAGLVIPESVEIQLWMNETFDFGSTNDCLYTGTIQYKPTGYVVTQSWPGGAMQAVNAPRYTLTLVIGYSNWLPGHIASCTLSLGIYLRNE